MKRIKFYNCYAEDVTFSNTLFESTKPSDNIASNTNFTYLGFGYFQSRYTLKWYGTSDCNKTIKYRARCICRWRKRLKLASKNNLNCFKYIRERGVL